MPENRRKLRKLDTDINITENQVTLPRDQKTENSLRLCEVTNHIILQAYLATNCV